MSTLECELHMYYKVPEILTTTVFIMAPVDTPAIQEVKQKWDFGKVSNNATLCQIGIVHSKKLVISRMTEKFFKTSGKS